jgi:hypothetical protein
LGPKWVGPPLEECRDRKLCPSMQPGQSPVGVKQSAQKSPNRIHEHCMQNVNRNLFGTGHPRLARAPNVNNIQGLAGGTSLSRSAPHDVFKL